jgi:hypothetical protein
MISAPNLKKASRVNLKPDSGEMIERQPKAGSSKGDEDLDHHSFQSRR